MMDSLIDCIVHCNESRIYCKNSRFVQNVWHTINFYVESSEYLSHKIHCCVSVRGVKMFFFWFFCVGTAHVGGTPKTSHLGRIPRTVQATLFGPTTSATPALPCSAFPASCTSSSGSSSSHHPTDCETLSNWLRKYLYPLDTCPSFDHIF